MLEFVEGKTTHGVVHMLMDGQIDKLDAIHPGQRLEKRTAEYYGDTSIDCLGYFLRRK
jgi:hypothetical protein